MAEDVRSRLIDRVGAIGPSDRVTARTMLEAVQVIKVLHDAVEAERRRNER
jgi:phospholipid N-methyltransferase